MSYQYTAEMKKQNERAFARLVKNFREGKVKNLTLKVDEFVFTVKVVKVPVQKKAPSSSAPAMG